MTKSVITYLYNYPELLNNVSILPVAHNLVMSKLFGYVNKVDSHNKSRHYYLALENTGLLSVDD